MNLDLTLSSLQDKGHKITNIRKEMVSIFSQAEKPLSAGDMQKALKTADVSVNKTTIYRELQFLVREGYLTEVYIRPQEISYEPVSLIHHHHLICEVCGRIESITNCLANDLNEDVLKKKGFKINKHSLEFYGICSNCPRNINNEKQ